MAQFTDIEGTVWIVDVTVWTIKQLRAKLGVELERAGDSDEESKHILSRIFIDPVFLCDVLFVVCEKQAEKNGIDDEAFASVMKGKVLADARKALIEALINFSQSDGKAEVIRRGAELMSRSQQLVIGETLKKLNDPKTEAFMENDIRRGLSDLFSNLLDRSE